MSVAAIASKELRQLSRDPRTLGIILVMPAALLLFYGYILSFDVRHVALAVVDADRTAASRALVRSMTASGTFDLALELEQGAQIRPALDAGKASLALVIPRGYAAALAAGEQATVQAILDGSDANTAQTAQAYAEGFVAAAGGRLAEEQGVTPEPRVSTRIKVLFNPDLASDRFLLPGLVAFILMVSSSITTAMSVVKERETGTMEQLLVSPLSPSQVIAGKALPYGALAVVAAVGVMATARVAFGLEIAGSALLLLGFIVLFVVGAQGLGLLISSITASQQVAFQAAAFLTLLPTLLLSGFIFPIRSMPLAVQVITYLVPARYFVEVLRGIVLKGVGAAELWHEAAALGVFAAVTLSLASWRLRRGRL